MFRTSTTRIAAVAAGLVAAGGVAQGDSHGITIGYAGGFTGYLAPYDQPSLNGVQLALEQINAAGGIMGMPVEIVVKDTRSDTAQAAVVAQELIDEGVVAMIVSCDVDPAVASGVMAQAAEIPSASSCASTPTLPAAVGPYMFSNYTADNLQGAVLAEYARGQGHENAYILLSRDTPYTEKLPEYFGEAFEAMGGTVVAVGEYTMGQQDFSAEVTNIGGLDPSPDVIQTSAYEPDFPAFIKQLRAAGIDTPVLGSDGIDSPTTFALGDVAEGVVFSNAGFASPGSALEAFEMAYEEKYGTPNDTVFTATGYDLMMVIAAAIEAAGTTDGPAIRDAWDNLENVQVATGSITYKDQNRVPVRVVALNQVSGGERVHVGDFSPDPSMIPAP
ncbi:MAG: ABC transporter substrate-binding protein [bacterium]|nr:ABC transporter substrate-binding protein [bacterium]